jgi:chromosome partitioning protein
MDMTAPPLPPSDAPVSRETDQPSPPPSFVSRETSAPDFHVGHPDTPIAAAAAAAVRVLNPRASDNYPKPASRRVMTIANQKGGVGKTTSTVNLAVGMALHGLRVLVLDLDPQGNASTALGIDHHADIPSIYDVLINGDTLAEVVQQVEGFDTLWCAPATLDLAGAEIEMVSVVAREYRLKRAVEAYTEPLDYVLIDCPPSLGLLTLNSLVAGAEVLIPIQCEFYALEGLTQLLRTIDMVKAHLNGGLTVSTILLTMYDSRTRLADQVAAEVRTHFGETVLQATIPRSVRVSEAPGYGQSVITYDPGSRGAMAYLDAAREIAHRAERESGSQ